MAGRPVSSRRQCAFALRSRLCFCPLVAVQPAAPRCVQRAAMCCSSERPASWVGCECSSSWPSRARSRRRPREGKGRDGKERESKGKQGKAREGKGSQGKGRERPRGREPGERTRSSSRNRREEQDTEAGTGRGKQGEGEQEKSQRGESSCRNCSRRGQCKQPWHAAVASSPSNLSALRGALFDCIAGCRPAPCSPVACSQLPAGSTLATAGVGEKALHLAAI